jgi:hypothetical protein
MPPPAIRILARVQPDDLASCSLAISRRQAEDARQDLVGVLAEQRRGPGRLARGRPANLQRLAATG